jgi:hypothetical protein
MCLPLLACAVLNFHQQSRKGLACPQWMVYEILPMNLDITVSPETINCLLPSLLSFRGILKFLQQSHEPHLQSFTHTWSAPNEKEQLWQMTLFHAQVNHVAQALLCSTPLQFQEFHTHIHTYTIDNSFKTFKSTLFLDFVHCLY